MWIIVLALCHAAAWYGLIARATQPKVRVYWYLLWVAPCWLAAWLFRGALGNPVPPLLLSAVAGIVVRWVNDFLRLHLGSEQMVNAGGPLKVSQNPGPIPRATADGWLPILADVRVMLASGPDGYTWPEALSRLQSRLERAGAVITADKSAAEWIIAVYGFAGNNSGYAIGPGGAYGDVAAVPVIKKRFEPYALIFSLKRPEEDLARDAAYDLCLLIGQIRAASQASERRGG